MTKRKRDRRIEENADFILSPKYNNSLSSFLADHPSGTTEAATCRLLDLNLHELRDVFNRALKSLKDKFGVSNGSKKV